MAHAPNPALPVSFFYACCCRIWFFFDFQNPRKQLPTPPKKATKSRRSKRNAPKSPEDAKKAKDALAKSQARKAAVKQHEMDPLTSTYPKLTLPGYNAILALYAKESEGDGIRSADPGLYKASAWYKSLTKEARYAVLDLFAKNFYLQICEYEYDGVAGAMGVWSNYKKIIWTYQCFRTGRKNATGCVDWMTAKNYKSVLAHATIVILDKLYSQKKWSGLTNAKKEVAKQNPVLRGNLIYMYSFFFNVLSIRPVHQVEGLFSICFPFVFHLFSTWFFFQGGMVPARKIMQAIHRKKRLAESLRASKKPKLGWRFWESWFWCVLLWGQHHYQLKFFLEGEVISI